MNKVILEENDSEAICELENKYDIYGIQDIPLTELCISTNWNGETNTSRKEHVIKLFQSNQEGKVFKVKTTDFDRPKATFIYTATLDNSGQLAVRNIVTIPSTFMGSQKTEMYLCKEFIKIYREFMGINYILINPVGVTRHSTKRSPNTKTDNYENDHIYSLLHNYKNTIKGDYTPGNGSKHKHEYDVKGHYRHYKNGKVVFVKGYTKCKGRGVKIEHEYLLENRLRSEIYEK